MKIIVCLDDNGGMMFNHRRQSRDKAVIADILQMSEGKRLYVDEYSEKLFSDAVGLYTVSHDMLDEASREDICFVENKSLSGIIDKVDEIVIYGWNRVYPADLYFDVDPKDEGFTLVESCDICGNSHEKITREIFTR